MQTRADTDALAFWQSRSRRVLRDCDAREIGANLTGFMRVLMDWENIERRELIADNPAESNGNDA
jgi:hypothetical protein